MLSYSNEVMIPDLIRDIANDMSTHEQLPAVSVSQSDPTIGADSLYRVDITPDYENQAVYISVTDGYQAVFAEPVFEGSHAMDTGLSDWIERSVGNISELSDATFGQDSVVRIGDAEFSTSLDVAINDWNSLVTSDEHPMVAVNEAEPEITMESFPDEADFFDLSVEDFGFEETVIDDTEGSAFIDNSADSPISSAPFEEQERNESFISTDMDTAVENTDLVSAVRTLVDERLNDGHYGPASIGNDSVGIEIERVDDGVRIYMISDTEGEKEEIIPYDHNDFDPQTFLGDSIHLDGYAVSVGEKDIPISEFHGSPYEALEIPEDTRAFIEGVVDSWDTIVGEAKESIAAYNEAVSVNEAARDIYAGIAGEIGEKLENSLVNTEAGKDLSLSHYGAVADTEHSAAGITAIHEFQENITPVIETLQEARGNLVEPDNTVRLDLSLEPQGITSISGGLEALQQGSSFFGYDLPKTLETAVKSGSIEAGEAGSAQRDIYMRFSTTDGKFDTGRIEPALDRLRSVITIGDDNSYHLDSRFRNISSDKVESTEKLRSAVSSEIGKLYAEHNDGRQISDISFEKHQISFTDDTNTRVSVSLNPQMFTSSVNQVSLYETLTGKSNANIFRSVSPDMVGSAIGTRIATNLSTDDKRAFMSVYDTVGKIGNEPKAVIESCNREYSVSHATSRVDMILRLDEKFQASMPEVKDRLENAYVQTSAVSAVTEITPLAKAVHALDNIDQLKEVNTAIESHDSRYDPTELAEQKAILLQDIRADFRAISAADGMRFSVNGKETENPKDFQGRLAEGIEKTDAFISAGAEIRAIKEEISSGKELTSADAARFENAADRYQSAREAYAEIRPDINGPTFQENLTVIKDKLSYFKPELNDKLGVKQGYGGHLFKENGMTYLDKSDTTSVRIEPKYDQRFDQNNGKLVSEGENWKESRFEERISIRDSYDISSNDYKRFGLDKDSDTPDPAALKETLLTEIDEALKDEIELKDSFNDQISADEEKHTPEMELRPQTESSSVKHEPKGLNRASEYRNKFSRIGRISLADKEGQRYEIQLAKGKEIEIRKEVESKLKPDEDFAEKYKEAVESYKSEVLLPIYEKMIDNAGWFENQIENKGLSQNGNVSRDTFANFKAYRSVTYIRDWMKAGGYVGKDSIVEVGVSRSDVVISFFSFLHSNIYETAIYRAVNGIQGAFDDRYKDIEKRENQDSLIKDLSAPESDVNVTTEEERPVTTEEKDNTSNTDSAQDAVEKETEADVENADAEEKTTDDEPDNVDADQERQDVENPESTDDAESDDVETEEEDIDAENADDLENTAPEEDVDAQDESSDIEPDTAESESIEEEQPEDADIEEDPADTEIQPELAEDILETGETDIENIQSETDPTEEVINDTENVLNDAEDVVLDTDEPASDEEEQATVDENDAEEKVESEPESDVERNPQDESTETPDKKEESVKDDLIASLSEDDIEMPEQSDDVDIPEQDESTDAQNVDTDDAQGDASSDIDMPETDTSFQDALSQSDSLSDTTDASEAELGLDTESADLDAYLDNFFSDGGDDTTEATADLYMLVDDNVVSPQDLVNSILDHIDGDETTTQAAQDLLGAIASAADEGDTALNSDAMNDYLSQYDLSSSLDNESVQNFMDNVNDYQFDYTDPVSKEMEFSDGSTVALDEFDNPFTGDTVDAPESVDVVSDSIDNTLDFFESDLMDDDFDDLDVENMAEDVDNGLDFQNDNIDVTSAADIGETAANAVESIADNISSSIESAADAVGGLVD